MIDLSTIDQLTERALLRLFRIDERRCAGGRP
jgi:hypothetical protein